MPERRRSSASTASSALWASRRRARSRSSSASAPSRMTPPADTSDRRFRRRASTRRGPRSPRYPGSTRRATGTDPPRALRRQRPPRERPSRPAARAATSRGPAVPTATRAKRRSRSPTSSSAACSASAISGRSTSSSTASQRDSSSTGSSDGWASASRRARAPSGVRVRSSSAQRLRAGGRRRRTRRARASRSRRRRVPCGDRRTEGRPPSRGTGRRAASRPAYARAAAAAPSAGRARPGRFGASTTRRRGGRSWRGRRASGRPRAGGFPSAGRAPGRLPPGRPAPRPPESGPVETSRKATPQSRSPGCEGGQIGGRARDERFRVEHGAGRDDARDVAPDEALGGAGVLDLVADGDLAAGRDQPRDVMLDAWCGTPHIGASMSESRWRGRQGDPEERRRVLRVVEEHLVEVAHPVEEDRVRDPALHLEVLPEHRGHARDRCAHAGASIDPSGGCACGRRAQRIMNVLALDTAGPMPSVAVLAGERLFEELLPRDRRASEELLPAIGRVTRGRGAPSRRLRAHRRLRRARAPSPGCASVWPPPGASGAPSAVPVEAVSTLEAIAEAARPWRRSARRGVSRRRPRRARRRDLRPLGRPRVLRSLPPRGFRSRTRRASLAARPSPSCPPDLAVEAGRAPSAGLAAAIARRGGTLPAAMRRRSAAIYSRPSAAEEKHGAA